jgi:gas vesicle protein
MGRFVNGVLLGVGVGLLIAPMRGEEMQRLLRERYEQLRSNLPEKEQVMQAGQQVAANLSQTASTLKGAAQQAASKVQDTGGALGNMAQQTAQQVKQTGQNTLNATRQAAQSVKDRGQSASTMPPAEGSETIILFENDMDV